jgi:hypothetical protein
LLSFGLMRAAAIPTLALPLLLAHCGAKGDLVIGSLEPVTSGGTSVIPSGGISAAGNAGGTETTVGGASASGGGGNTETGGTAAGSPEGGAPDNVGGDGSNCTGDEQPPVDSLLHRYSFDGTGTTVTDSVGTAHGSLVGGAKLDGSGVLTLTRARATWRSCPRPASPTARAWAPKSRRPACRRSGWARPK